MKISPQKVFDDLDCPFSLAVAWAFAHCAPFGYHLNDFRIWLAFARPVRATDGFGHSGAKRRLLIVLVNDVAMSSFSEEAGKSVGHRVFWTFGVAYRCKHRSARVKLPDKNSDERFIRLPDKAIVTDKEW